MRRRGVRWMRRDNRRGGSLVKWISKMEWVDREGGVTEVKEKVIHSICLMDGGKPK
jgi:hypothetical protein